MPNAEELIKRAKELVPVLRERAEMTDELRRVPDETVADLRAAELLKVVQPVRYGGFGLEFGVLFEIGVQFGRASGSAAWCYSQWATHNWMLGSYPQRAQEEFWADTTDIIASTSFDPTGATVTAVDGGYRLSGRWGFSSGCDAATWEMLGAIAPEGYLLLAIPLSDYLVEDTWFVSGLKGSGSKHIRVEDAFVPTHRAMAVHDLGEGHSAGREIHDSPLYRFPAFLIFPFVLGAPMVGMAQGALDAYEEYTRERITVYSGQKTAEFALQQAKLAESSVEVDAARLIMDRDAKEVADRARRGDVPSLEDRVRFRRDQGYVAKLCAQSANRLFEASGGNVLFEGRNFARFHRDILAANHHPAVVWDTVAEQYGRVRMGLEPTHPFY